MLLSLNPRLKGTLITEQPDLKVLRVFPEPAVRLAVEDVYRDVYFPERRKRPYVLINMVSSLDGKAVVEGKAGSIGSPTDRAIMSNLRARADAVMIGAGTLRAEKLTLAVPEDLALERASRGLKPQPLAVVATTSGNIPLTQHLLNASPDNLLVFTSPATPCSRLAELSQQASVENPANPREALGILKERYAVHILLVEGGPSLNHVLISEGLVDEIFLTLSPKLLGGEEGGPGPLTILEGLTLDPHRTARFDPISIHLSDGELFLRYSAK